VADFNIRRLIGALPDLTDDEVRALYNASQAEYARRNKKVPTVHFFEHFVAISSNLAYGYGWAPCGARIYESRLQA